MMLHTCDASAYNAYLQVGVFRHLKNAQVLQAEIKRLNNYSVIIKKSSQTPNSNYVLVIEGFQNKKSARKLQVDLKKSGHPSLLKKLSKKQRLFAMMPYPAIEEAKVTKAYQKLLKAKKNPEYMINNQLVMPVSPDLTKKAVFRLHNQLPRTLLYTYLY